AKRANLLPAPRELVPGVPSDLEGLCMTLMRAEPSERPALQDIRARIVTASVSSDIVRQAFVGRAVELERLRQALAHAQTNATPAVVVRGEPGIGKSALVERFLSGIGPEVVVLRGRCYEQESVPFGGIDSLIDSLSEYLLGLPANELGPLLVGGVSSI